jgi:hypothetical protein
MAEGMGIRVEHDGYGWVVREVGRAETQSVHGSRTVAEIRARELGEQRRLAVVVRDRDGSEHPLTEDRLS